MIRIYDTMAHEKRPFIPCEEGKVGMYVCGPTVYNYIHIGNARTFISFDTIRRYLMWRGFEVPFVQNITVRQGFWIPIFVLVQLKRLAP